MIVWSGWGIFAGVIPVGCYWLMSWLCARTYGAAYTQAHSWPGALGTFVGAMAVYVLSERLDRSARTLVDQQTGEEVKLRRRDSLFFVPLRFWPVILLVVGFYILIFQRESTI